MKASIAPVHGDLGRVEAGLAPLPDMIDALRTDLSSLPFVSKSKV
jgi:hypothetical protein